MPSNAKPQELPIEIDRPYPLDGVELDSVSDEEPGRLFRTAPVLYQAGSNKVMRISQSLVLKVAGTVSQGEVMDVVPGNLLENAWPDLDTITRESVAAKVAEMIDRMQYLKISDMPPGPVDYEEDKPWRDPYFTEHGAGPFPNLQDLEDWYNHKLDVCIRLKRATDETRRFSFTDVALAHQDISPRNLILQEGNRDLCLIAFGFGGIYPTGFEQAALARQGTGEWDEEFRDVVLPKLSYQGERELEQLEDIMYGLTTGAFL